MAEKPVLDERFIQQSFAELIQSTGIAMGIFAAAVARSGNAQKLAAAMRENIKAATEIGGESLAVRIATYALDGVEAEVTVQLSQGLKPPKQ
jgi:hypothetical protein